MVMMRQFSPESLMWQTVEVGDNGAGVLITLIGEQVGAVRTPFRLAPARAALLRRLVAGARSVEPPPQGAAPRATLYTLHIRGEPGENLQGPMRRPLARLVGFLSGLMLRYCC